MPDVSTSLSRYAVTISKAGSRRQRTVVVPAAGSEQEAALLAQREHCRSGETAILAYRLRQS